MTDSRKYILVIGVVLFVTSIGVGLVSQRLFPLGYNASALSNSYKVLTLQGIYNDSWGVMDRAIEYISSKSSGDRPVYSEIFFHEGRKFQYPLTALFPYFVFKTELNATSMAFFLMMIASSCLILELGWKRAGLPRGSPADVVLRGLLVVFAAMTFYPVVKAFTLGQIQVWLNAIFAVSILSWMLDRRMTSGILIGLFALVKPHFGLYVLWGALRRRGSFTWACLLTGAVGLFASVLAFGFVNNIDYLSVLDYLSKHPESYHPNNSAGGLLNRIVGIGRPEIYDNVHSDLFLPPYNAWVYVASTVVGILIILWTLIELKSRQSAGGLYDFCAMGLTCVVASPIAWEHHYGVLLPVFLVLLPLCLRAGRAATMILAILYIVASNYWQILNILADSPFNVLQSYLWFVGLAMIAMLHWAGRCDDAMSVEGRRPGSNIDAARSNLAGRNG